MQVVLPILSASGLSCAMLPTALLSTHTGGFGQVYKRDLWDDMAGILRHWQSFDQRFDAVYVGYLGGAPQADLVLEALPQLMAPGARLFVDPVMGDQGKAYTFCGPDMVDGFRALCRKADVIFPNRTEAALLLGLPMAPGEEPDVPGESAILSLGAHQAVLSGVVSDEGQIGVTAYETGRAPQTFMRPRHPGSYPGTGDTLAACLIAGLARGKSLAAACDIALDFIAAAFDAAISHPRPARYGLPFELALLSFIRALGI